MKSHRGIIAIFLKDFTDYFSINLIYPLVGFHSCMMGFSRIGLIVLLCVGAVCCAWEECTVVPVRLDRSDSESEPWRTLSAEEEEKEAQTRLFRLDVFGKQLVLRLEPDQNFLAPGFVFHVVGSPESGPVREAESAAEPGCFFSGTVNGEERSAAALNLCHGLTGGFYFQGEEYFIQPLNSSQFRSVRKEEDAHMVRRRSRATLAQEGSSKCGVSEDEEKVPKNLEQEASHGAPNADQTGNTERILRSLL